MNAAFVLCPCWTNYSPPLGIAYLSAVAKQLGHKARCFDANISVYASLKSGNTKFWDFDQHFQWIEPHFSSGTLPAVGKYLDRNVDDILAFKPDLVCFTVFYTNALASVYAAKRIKEKDPSIKILFGGAECYKEIAEAKFLSTGFVDGVAVGEGEDTLREFLGKYSPGAPLPEVKGLFTLKDGRASGELRGELKDLDELPLPEFGDFDIKLYAKSALPVMMSRGCVNKCTFCGEILYWKNFRSRRAESIYEEMRRGAVSRGVEEFFCNDSLINGNLKELSRLADMIIAGGGFKARWGGYARVHKNMSLDLLKRMNRAGCTYLSFGIESGSEKVLADMNKRISLSDAVDNLKNSREAGIETHVNWIVGFPTEGWADFFLSLLFIVRNRKIISHFNPGQVPCGIPLDSYIAKNMALFKIAPAPFLGSWRTAYYKNTIIHRIIRLKILRFVLNLFRISHS